jgi:hypothetical protein
VEPQVGADAIVAEGPIHRPSGLAPFAVDPLELRLRLGAVTPPNFDVENPEIAGGRTYASAP